MKHARAEIAGALTRLLRTEVFAFSDAAAIGDAIEAYAAGRGDFADYVIRAQAVAAGARDVVTFDRVLKAEGRLRVIG